MTFRWPHRHFVPIGSLLLGACASAVLTPAPDARPVPGLTSAAQADLQGVHVVAEVNAWPGDVRVVNHVHPIRVTIENHSDATIRIRYDDFALVRADGRRHAALPPVRVEGELFSPMLSMGIGPVGAPGFSYRRFYLAPYFAPLYPGVPVYRRAYVFYDPAYYSLWYTDFARSVRPSVEVLSMALPEGVLEPDGRITGFLYFRTLEAKAASVSFRVRIVAIRDSVATLGGTVLGEASIPFTVSAHR